MGEGKTAEDSFVMLQSRTLEQLNYPFTPKCTGKYCLAVAEVSEKKLFYKCLYIFQTFFLYICIYLCFYYKIARIKLLASLASFVGARVKAVSVKKINYLYRCGIEASSKL